MTDKIGLGEDSYVLFFCLGCDEHHAFIYGKPEGWTWNGSTESPTFSPSILVGGVQWAEGEPFYKPRHKGGSGDPIVCHSFITDGRIEYLSDCTHPLAGQTVDLPDWPYSPKN